jgi:hypothetical protein
MTSPVAHNDLRIGGLPPLFLHREASTDGRQPEFLGATLLPGRGMNVFQVRAAFPGLGEMNLLASPSLEEAQQVVCSQNLFGPEKCPVLLYDSWHRPDAGLAHYLRKLP